jgi:hypothetical protein
VSVGLWRMGMTGCGAEARRVSVGLWRMGMTGCGAEARRVSVGLWRMVDGDDGLAGRAGSVNCHQGTRLARARTHEGGAQPVTASRSSRYTIHNQPATRRRAELRPRHTQAPAGHPDTPSTINPPPGAAPGCGPAARGRHRSSRYTIHNQPATRRRAGLRPRRTQAPPVIHCAPPTRTTRTSKTRTDRAGTPAGRPTRP